MAHMTFEFSITIIIIYYVPMAVGGYLPGIITGRQSYWGYCDRDSPEYDIMSDDRTYNLDFDDSMNCKDNEWIINWDQDDLGKTINRKNCKPVPPSQYNGWCSSCLCARDSSGIDCTDIDGYKLGPKPPNIDENKVVTGHLIVPYGSFIELHVSYATLLSDGTVADDKSWRSSMVYSSSDDKCNHFSNNLRTIYTDNIILAAKYVVTGIRMVAIEKTAVRKGWKLEVQGTEYDSSFKLKSGTDKWFDYANDDNNDTSYDRNRTEIYLMNDDEYINTAEDITDTNHYVRIRVSNLNFNKHLSQPGIGGFFVQRKNIVPLRGVLLLYGPFNGYENILTLDSLLHESFSSTPTTSTVPPTIETATTTKKPPTTSTIPTTIKTTTTTTKKPPTTPLVVTTIKTTIETTTDKPKIVPVIKLRTTTSTTEAPSFFSINVSTQTEPTVQPKVKRMRTHPVNISCKSKFETESRQDEMADILGDLFIPIDNDQNSAPEFFNQLILTLPLLFYILL